MHERAIDALVDHLVNLAAQLSRLQTPVPGPQRDNTEFPRRIPESFIERNLR